MKLFINDHNCFGIVLWSTKKRFVAIFRLKPNSDIEWHCHPGILTKITPLAGEARSAKFNGYDIVSYRWPQVKRDPRYSGKRTCTIHAGQAHAAHSFDKPYWYLSRSTVVPGYDANPNPAVNFLKVNFPAVDAGSGDAAQPAPKSPLS